MRINKNIIISIGFITFLISALIYNLLYSNNEKNEIIQEIENIEIENNEEEKEEKMIYIHIDGEVINPGMYKLPEGSRINDAINIAGGIKNDADLTDINLAYVLSDAMKVSIPKKETNEKKEIISTGSTSSKGNNNVVASKNDVLGLININTASKEQLKNLTGIGDAIADRIIDYREINGKFNSIEELKNVSGIGESKYSKIKNNITI